MSVRDEVIDEIVFEIEKRAREEDRLEQVSLSRGNSQDAASHAKAAAVTREIVNVLKAMG